MRELTWRSAGPRIGISDVKRFETAYSVELPTDYVDLLINYSNGGVPDRQRFPIIGLDHDDHSILHGMLGIWHPNRNLDLGYHIYLFHEDFDESALPIGYDDLGGNIVLKTKSEPIGQVCYRPADMRQVPFPGSCFLISESLHHFIHNLS